jgi:hypothetical protein
LKGWRESNLRRVEAGSLLHLPANREHAFPIVSERSQTIIARAGFESFFTATGVPVDRDYERELPQGQHRPRPAPPCKRR